MQSGPSVVRRLSGKFMLVFLCTALGFGCDDANNRRKPSPHPNVVLVVIDSLRADHLQSYGYAHETSPSLDRLAREGARFETAVVPTSWSLPSFVTLLTALPPEQHGVVQADLALSDDALTLAEVLQDRGFATAAFVSGPDLEPSRGLAQGFDTYLDVPPHRTDSSREEVPPPAERSAGPLSEADAWLTAWDRAGRDRPFFLFVHLPLPYDDNARTTPDDEAHRQDDREASAVARRIERYDAAIRSADREFGQLAQRLDALELREQTLVVVTSDHGEEFGERGHFGHGNTLSAESVRVPLIIRFPSHLDAGKVVTEPARLMDIGATIMMLGRVRRPEAFGFRHAAYGFAMRDLTELLLGTPSDKHVVVSGDLYGKSQSLRLASHKLIRHLADNGDERYELFDLDIDPGEGSDISASEERRTAVYVQKLEAWRQICAERPRFAIAHQPATN